ncbi:DUF4153 domain-containing protein [Saccharospirillum salsuginis]|uniref:DUF4173 domain-containing protein n=1 Tax=Saccharospirillum salsuginis TaxID=418750 RepID=A0A918KH63_9GAMM|nr:DUF4173 domain-containing protein [Saccharospirillum salsuginis]GGX62753.1 hypothetical protein GCM10007392_33320 [Saccharospirillum salsuginis]
MENETTAESSTLKQEALKPEPVKRETLMWALLLGVLGDMLLREGVIGPGLALWVGLAGCAATGLAWRVDKTQLRSVAGWSAVALVAAGMMVLRDSPSLRFLLFLLLPVALSHIVMLSWGARLGRSLPVDHLYGLLSVPARALIGGAPLLDSLRMRRGRVVPRLMGIGRGLILALPLLWIFSGLLSSADAAFNRFADQAFDWFTVSDLTSHVVIALVLAWVVSGWLKAVLDRGHENLFLRLPLPRIGRDETLIVLGSLALLFGGFVVLQLSYLFGGYEAIQGVSGLTVANYARRGFFELVVIAGLTLGVLLVARAVTSSQRLYQWLALVLVGLVLVMLISAVQRFVLYIDAFGLSLDRLTVLAILLWLALTLVIFATTVLRGQFSWFASGSTLAGIAVVLLLALMNPAAWVARVNMDRAIDHQQSLDTDYLVSLGADAVPTVLDRLDQLPQADRCTLAAELLWRWHTMIVTQPDWRVWNRAQAKAVDGVAERHDFLRAASEGCAVNR